MRTLLSPFTYVGIALGVLSGFLLIASAVENGVSTPAEVMLFWYFTTVVYIGQAVNPVVEPLWAQVSPLVLGQHLPLSFLWPHAVLLCLGLMSATLLGIAPTASASVAWRRFFSLIAIIAVLLSILAGLWLNAISASASRFRNLFLKASFEEEIRAQIDLMLTWAGAAAVAIMVVAATLYVLSLVVSSPPLATALRSRAVAMASVPVGIALLVATNAGFLLIEGA